jgi:hypothetical protein
MSGQLHAPATLPPAKESRYSLDRRTGWPQNRSGRCGEEKNLALPGIEPWWSSPLTIAIPTELSRLLVLARSSVFILSVVFRVTNTVFISFQTVSQIYDLHISGLEVIDGIMNVVFL